MVAAAGERAASWPEARFLLSASSGRSSPLDPCEPTKIVGQVSRACSSRSLVRARWCAPPNPCAASRQVESFFIARNPAELAERRPGCAMLRPCTLMSQPYRPVPTLRKSEAWERKTAGRARTGAGADKPNRRGSPRMTCVPCSVCTNPAVRQINEALIGGARVVLSRAGSPCPTIQCAGTSRAALAEAGERGRGGGPRLRASNKATRCCIWGPGCATSRWSLRLPARPRGDLRGAVAGIASAARILQLCAELEGAIDYSPTTVNVAISTTNIQTLQIAVVSRKSPASGCSSRPWMSDPRLRQGPACALNETATR